MNNIVLTSYFTGKPDPQRGSRWEPNNPELMAGWACTLFDIGLGGIIFHDEAYGCVDGPVELSRYDLQSDIWSVNDERFLCWWEYLKMHPDIDNVFLTDLFDVTFHRDPFALINEDHDLYVGCGAGFPKAIGENKWLCNKMMAAYGRVYYADKCTVNAGVIGGRRDNVLRLIEYMVREFVRLESPDNINMAVFNKSVYDLFDPDRLMIGPPVTSLFKKYQQSGGFCIIHK